MKTRKQRKDNRTMKIREIYRKSAKDENIEKRSRNTEDEWGVCYLSADPTSSRLIARLL
jgi:hypothetical protein